MKDEEDKDPNPIKEAWEALGLVLGVILLLVLLFGSFMEVLEYFGIKF